MLLDMIYMLWLHAGMLDSGASASYSRAGASASRPSTVTHAQGRRRAVEDDVDLDDEEYFDDAQARPCYKACFSLYSWWSRCHFQGTTFPR